MEKIAYVVYQNATIIRGAFGREKINGERGVCRAVSGRHTLRRPKISGMNSSHETLIQVHSYRHVAGLTCCCNRRLELRVQ